MAEPFDEPFRSEYVRHELELAELVLDLSTDIAQRLVRAIGYAVYGPSHEGRRYSYGEIVCAQRFEDYGVEVGRYARPAGSHQLSRESADGIRSFFLSSGRDNFVVFYGELRSELAFFNLRDSALRSEGLDIQQDDFWIVVRNESGTCRVFGTRGMATIRGGNWFVRPYQYELKAEEVLANRGWTGGRFSPTGRMVRAILQVGVHALGETNSGATFLLLPDDFESKVESVPGLNFERATQCHNLTLDSGADILLAHLLRQRDGITIVKANTDGGSGLLCWTSVFVMVGGDDAGTMRSKGGARQLSAWATSRLLPDCVVVSVSSDGPVRVWLGGNVIASTVTDDER